MDHSERQSPEGGSGMAAPRAASVRARHAASLIVVRGAVGAANAVLMGMRGAGHRFMPNRLVFPGGAVDAADMRIEPATSLPAATLAGLSRNANPRLAAALAIAAARELDEETGLSLGTPPALDGMQYLCRAVTPPGLPIRFNARFLIVAEDRVGGALAGSGELENLRFYDIEEALALDLAWITRSVLVHARDRLALPAAERAARTKWPVCRSKVWAVE